MKLICSLIVVLSAAAACQKIACVACAPGDPGGCVGSGDGEHWWPRVPCPDVRGGNANRSDLRPGTPVHLGYDRFARAISNLGVWSRRWRLRLRLRRSSIPGAGTECAGYGVRSIQDEISAEPPVRQPQRASRPSTIRSRRLTCSSCCLGSPLHSSRSKQDFSTATSPSAAAPITIRSTCRPITPRSRPGRRFFFCTAPASGAMTGFSRRTSAWLPRSVRIRRAILRSSSSRRSRGIPSGWDHPATWLWLRCNRPCGNFTSIRVVCISPASRWAVTAPGMWPTSIPSSSRRSCRSVAGCGNSRRFVAPSRLYPEIARRSWPTWCSGWARSRSGSSMARWTMVVNVNGSREPAAALKAAGADVHYTELLGLNHNSWDAAFASEEFRNWLFAQQRR